MVFNQIEGLKVVVDDVSYMPNLNAPSDKPYPFIYFLSVQNDSKVTVRLMGRKWIVEEANGETIVVEGDGIVGQMPVLSPGEKFSYNSCHVIASNAESLGAFYGITKEGEKFMVEIPPFKLRLPK